MATGALVLIIGTQLLFYSAVAYLIWSLRKKIAEHDLETGRALRETLSPRFAKQKGTRSVAGG